MKVAQILAPLDLRPLTIGVVADTHVSSRSGSMNPDIFRILADRHVDLIFHLGDIATRTVIDQLGEIAPVFAVRGNRDLDFSSVYPEAILMKIGLVSIGLTHGHGPMPHYLWDKFQYYLTGFRIARYRKLLDELFPTADVRLFGHTHVALSRRIDSILYFNPGAAGKKSKHDPHTSIGILTLDELDHVDPEIVYLSD